MRSTTPVQVRNNHAVIPSVVGVIMTLSVVCRPLRRSWIVGREQLQEEEEAAPLDDATQTLQGALQAFQLAPQELQNARQGRDECSCGWRRHREPGCCPAACPASRPGGQLRTDDHGTGLCGGSCSTHGTGDQSREGSLPFATQYCPKSASLIGIANVPCEPLCYYAHVAF